MLVRYMEAIEMVCCIRGYHVYKEIWEPVAGEVLMCEREPHNSLDQYAVAVKKKNGNYHQTFTTKVIKSMFTLFAMRQYD